MSELSKFRFPVKKDREFTGTLRARVNAYFAQQGLSTHATRALHWKTAVVFILYLLPFAAIFMWGGIGAWFVLAMWILMGLGAAGIGTNVMHDALHGATYRSPKANYWAGLSMNILGGHAPSWKLQHNVLHHAYTNVHGADMDIVGPPLLRFSPHDQWRPIHRYQHIYAWPLYGLMTLFRTFLTDFTNLWEFRKAGVLPSGKEFKKLFANLLSWKIAYLAVFLLLPLLLAPVAWYITVVGFVLMHFVTGLFLSLVFQCAHVLDTCDFPLPADEEGGMTDAWAVHQLRTTSNFAPRSKWFSWFVGGLNFQVEHHLFQHISHAHYKAISEIVRKTAAEFGVVYHSQPTFAHAVYRHGVMLHRLGRKP
jgi:linoleoyl-CoA desaturase